MTLLTLKHNAKKAWLWLKANWKLPLLAVSILVSFIFFRSKAQALIGAFMENREGYKEQVKVLDDLHEKEIAERDKLLASHEKEVEKLNLKKAEKAVTIEAEKKEDVEELKKSDIKDLAEKLGKEFDL